MLLYEKYTPYTLNAFIGNKSSIKLLEQFGLDAQSGKRPRPIIVYGPPGTGKTTALRAIAYSHGFELVEITSSDYRNAETLKKKLLPAVTSRGLFSKVSLILFDEIDELSDKFDQGAQATILQMLKEAKQPIAFTANDYWDQRISFLRNHAEKVEFKKITSIEVTEYLKKVLKDEKMSLDEGVIKEIAARSNGDVRGALNDLQMVLLGGNSILENLGVRNRKLEIFRVLDGVFLSNNFSKAKEAVDEGDVDLSMLINWVEENIPNRYWLKQSVAKAYSEISFASRFFQMAERVRYYGYLKYATTGIAGVSISSEGKMKYLSPYTFPSKVKFLSTTKETRGANIKIAAKLSPFLHTNRHEIINSYLPMFKKFMGSSSDEEKEKIRRVFEDSVKLEKEEIEYLTNS